MELPEEKKLQDQGKDSPENEEEEEEEDPSQAQDEFTAGVIPCLCRISKLLKTLNISRCLVH